MNGNEYIGPQHVSRTVADYIVSMPTAWTEKPIEVVTIFCQRRNARMVKYKYINLAAIRYDQNPTGCCFQGSQTCVGFCNSDKTLILCIA